MFRAIPIAGAALLGQRFGKRRLWIFGALILQAVIFGAAHANYPNQPAYARLVELILPSIGWGLIYLYFGLLPAIVLHFTVDVVAVSMPLFVSSTPGIWIDRTIVIVLTLVPLWVVLWSRLRAGKWNILSDQHFNSSWQPPAKPQPKPQIEQPHPVSQISRGTKRFVLVTGIIGLILWFAAGDFESPLPPLTIDRTEVENLARKNLTDRGIELPESWKLLATVMTPLNQDDRFVWQNATEQQYKDMIGNYLDTPYWYVRFVQFEGDVAERAEEYKVYIPKETETPRLVHILPEARQGANLTEPQAREIAHTFIVERYQLDPAELEEISAIPAKRPDRTDWEFTFRDKQNYPLEQGQGRITIEISGDEVTDYYSYIHIPEEWERQDRNRQNLMQIIQSLGGLVIVVALLAALIISVINWSRGKFSFRTFRRCQFLLIGLGIISYINDWPNMIAGFTTADPFSSQVFRNIATSILMMMFGFSCLALLAGFLQDWMNRLPQDTGEGSIWVGFSLGAALAGLGAIVDIFFKPISQPYWPEYENFGAYIPALATACQEILIYIPAVIVLLLLFASLEKFTRSWTRRKLLASALLILLGLITAEFNIDTISSWLTEGLVTGVIIIVMYRFVLRSNLSLLPAVIAASLIFDQIRQAMINPYPGAIGAALLSITMIVVMTIYCRRKLLTTQTSRHLPGVL